MVNKSENPVGPEEPTVAFKMPLWQVFAILFAVAALFTVFKLLEQNYLAPRQEIRWEPFNIAELEDLRRQGRNVLLMVRSVDKNENEKMNRVLKLPQIRKQIYFLKPAGRILESQEAISDSSRDDIQRDWVKQNTNTIHNGGLALLGPTSRTPDWEIPAKEVTAERLVGEIGAKR